MKKALHRITILLVFIFATGLISQTNALACNAKSLLSEHITLTKKVTALYVKLEDALNDVQLHSDRLAEAKVKYKDCKTKDCLDKIQTIQNSLNAAQSKADSLQEQIRMTSLSAQSAYLEYTLCKNKDLGPLPDTDSVSGSDTGDSGS